MTSLRTVLDRAMVPAVPSRDEEERLLRLAQRILEDTRRAAESCPEVRGVVLGGSFAKGTWLPGHADVDVFVKIDPATPEERFEEIGLGVGARAMRGYPKGKKFAQHPYTEATVDGVKVNIVPCYDVEAKHWKSAADRSPFHVELVRELPPGQKNQVRLLKRFMRGIGVYGAEIEVQGFSGYVAEVLVVLHGSMEGALRFFADLKRQDQARLFTLPDPVDASRDLALAISNEKLARMILASREFLSTPGESYFGAMKGRSRAEAKRRVVSLVFTHPRMSEDTIWGELRRTLKHLVRHMEEKGFRVARALPASNNSDTSAFLFIPEIGALPEIEQRVGPTVDRRKDAEAFIAANRKRAKLVWVDDEARVRILQEREHTQLSSLLLEMARKGSKAVGASDEVGRGMARSGRVLEGLSLKRAASSRPWLGKGIEEIAGDTVGTG